MRLDHVIPEEEPTPREEPARSWEWPGLAEGVAMLLFFLVALGATVGMLLRLFNPRRRVKALQGAVERVASDAAAPVSATPPALR